MALNGLQHRKLLQLDKSIVQINFVGACEECRLPSGFGGRVIGVEVGIDYLRRELAMVKESR